MASPTPSYRRGTRAPWVALALVALLALTLLPGAARAQQFVSYFQPSACPVAFPDEVTVDCGYVVVPESHNNFDGTVLRLAVAILRSPNPNKAPDPVFYLEGGPGGSPLTSGAGYAELFSLTLLNSRDVVLIDQRGTGYSEPGLFCAPPEAQSFGRRFPLGVLPADEPPPEVQAAANEVAACLQGLANAGSKLQYYNSAESSADLEDIRRALGFGQINLVGTSYGTRLALEAMRFRPETIRSAVIDSNVPPQTDALVLGPLSSLNSSLTGLAAACNAEATCAAAFGDVGADFDSVYTRLNANPQVLPIYDLDTLEVIDYLPITGVDFTFVTFQLMYVTQLIPIMPAFLSTTADGDYTLLSLFVSALLTSEGNPRSFADGMFYSFICNEFAPGRTVEDFVNARNRNLRTAGVAFSLQSNEALLGVCSSVELTGGYPGFNAPVTSSVPTFLVAGEFDPITPPSYSETAAATLSNKYYAVYPRGGHVPSFSSPCLFFALAEFIDNPAAAPDTSCVAAEAQPFLSPDAAQATMLELKSSGKLLQLVQQAK